MTSQTDYIATVPLSKPAMAREINTFTVLTGEKLTTLPLHRLSQNVAVHFGLLQSEKNVFLALEGL